MTMYVIERWTGKAWAPSMCSPYKSLSAARKHLDEYWWHYTDDHPYRIVDHKPKKVQKYVPKYKAYQDWNSDKGMVTVNY